MSGDKWESKCGTVTLYRGDCRDILPGMDTCDAVVTDPPYCLSYKSQDQIREKGNGTRTLVWKFDRDANGKEIGAAIGGFIRKCTGAVFCFCGPDYLSHWAADASEAGFIVKPAAWVKKHPPPAGKGNWWPSGFELAFYGFRRGAWFGDTDTKRSNVFVADAYRHGQPGKTGHPTQKPLSVVTRIVSSICPPGGLCVDPFMGSGTTAAACIKTRRRFVGVEIDPAYFDMAVSRVKSELQ